MAETQRHRQPEATWALLEAVVPLSAHKPELTPAMEAAHLVGLQVVAQRVAARLPAARQVALQAAASPLALHLPVARQVAH